jgi:transcriptional regulator with XRE-family HTH domain
MNGVNILKKHRKATGLTQQQLADQSGVPLSTIQKIEVKNRNIGRYTMERLHEFDPAAYPREMLFQQGISGDE